MRKYDLPFEDRDITSDPVQRQEMIDKTSQRMSPCVEIDGHMLADVSGEEVETFLLAKGLVAANDRPVDAPINACCGRENPKSVPIQVH